MILVRHVAPVHVYLLLCVCADVHSVVSAATVQGWFSRLRVLDPELLRVLYGVVNAAVSVALATIGWLLLFLPLARRLRRQIGQASETFRAFDLEQVSVDLMIERPLPERAITVQGLGISARVVYGFGSACAAGSLLLIVLMLSMYSPNPTPEEIPGGSFVAAVGYLVFGLRGFGLRHRWSGPRGFERLTRCSRADPSSAPKTEPAESFCFVYRCRWTPGLWGAIRYRRRLPVAALTLFDDEVRAMIRHSGDAEPVAASD